jgi:hypothetical protein
MPRKQESLDLLFVATSRQFPIPPARSQGHGGLVIGLVLIPTDHAPEGLLIGLVGAIHKITHNSFSKYLCSRRNARDNTTLLVSPKQILLKPVGKRIALSLLSKKQFPLDSLQSQSNRN